MDVWDDFEIRGGVAYPEDPFLYEALVDTEAERLLREQVRDATERLHNPTDARVRALVRYRLTATASTCTRALDRMMHWPVFDAMAEDIRRDVEMEEHQEFLQNLQQQIHEQEQELGVQMPLPLGPEWDPPAEVAVPEEDPEEDPAMVEDQEMQAALALEEEESEDDSEDEDLEMIDVDPEFEPLGGLELDQEQLVALADLEGAPEVDWDAWDSGPEYSPTSPGRDPPSPSIWT